MLKLTSTKYGENANSVSARVTRHSSYVKFYIRANLSQNVGSLMERGRAYLDSTPVEKDTLG